MELNSSQTEAFSLKEPQFAMLRMQSTFCDFAEAVDGRRGSAGGTGVEVTES